MLQKSNVSTILVLLTLAVLPACAPKQNSGVTVEPGGSGGVILSTGSKSTRPALKLEWVSPAFVPGEIVHVYKKLNIEVRASTAATLKDGDFKVFVDEKLLAAKSGEAPLEVMNKQEYIFRKTIEFPEGEAERHAIRVEVNNGGVMERTRTILVQCVLLPPKISIVWTKPDATDLGGRPFLQSDPEMEISATIETGGSALDVAQIRLRYNGNVMQPSENAVLRPSSGRYSFKDKLKLLNSNELEQSLSIIVENTESDILKIRYTANKKPNLYVLSIGTQTNLQYTVQDAKDFAGLFKNQDVGNAMYNKVFLEEITGPKASTQGIREAIELLDTKMRTGDIGPNDLIIVFLSTHGFMLNNDLRLQGEDFSSSKERATSVSFNSDVLQVLSSLNCYKLIFMDACHSGGAFDPAKSGAKATASEVERALAEWARLQKGLAIVASSSGDEISYEDKAWGNGAFTEAIVRALKEGKADANANGVITVNELFAYIKGEVPRMVRSIKNNKVQTPKMQDRDKIGDLPFYVVKK